ncbi:MAG: hypothetical protein OIF34_09420 [Porticoccaceae bacterium]|nr:hypothetical protein [Porticoccaceae bacterium]
MQVIKTLRPGSPGTKRFLSRYGNRLVAVRYRRDDSRKRFLTTIEVVVDQRPLHDSNMSCADSHGLRRKSWVKLRVDWKEKEIQHAVKQEGGRWLAHEQLWILRYDKAVVLGLIERMYPDMDTFYEDGDLDY